jgi:serine/threonine-protein kinase HipA
MLKELVVYIYLEPEGWVPCGLLEYDERGRLSNSAFRYGRKYLDRSNAIAVDPIQLPLRDETFVTSEGFFVFNGIRDAGPDKWGRYLLDKKFGRELSEVEYIAASGQHRVGALGFSNDPNHGPKIYTRKGFSPSHEKLLDLAFCAGAIQDIEKSEDSERLKKYLEYGPSLGGARPKANVIWNGKLHLAKFSLSRDQRNEPLIEYAAMTLAAKCGLKVPSVDKTEALGRSVYLIERFDRKKDTPIPFISGLTITGIHESDFSVWSYHLLVDAIVKYSTDPERDLRELFGRMIYNILIYNNDDHPRNVGFLYSGKNHWDISPLYDVVPTTIHTQTYSLAMVIGLGGKKASLTNALSQCERFRLSRTDSQRIILELESQVYKWREHFESCGVSESNIKALENGFSAKP